MDPGYVKALVGKVSNLFVGKEKTSGEKWAETMLDQKKTKISVLQCSLQRAIDFFDFMSKKNGLLVYYEPNNVLKTMFEIKFLQDYAHEIEPHLAFIGVLGNSSEIHLIEKFLPAKDKPFVVSFTYNDLGELETCGLMEVTKDTLNDKKYIMDFLRIVRETANNYNDVFQKSMKSLQAKMGGQGFDSPQHGNQYDPYDDHDYVDPAELDLRKQFSNDRRMKSSQDQAYEDALKKIQQEKEAKILEEQKKQQEAKEREAKERELSNLKAMFEKEVVAPEFAIQILLRLPSGQRIPRNFDRRSKISHVMNYVRSLDQKGFENPNADFSLISGYPPMVLDVHKTLHDIFGNSENEMIQVREN